MKKILLAFALLLSQHTVAFAWNEEGHSIVAEIAQRRLTPTALAKVKQILGGEIALASVSSWADDIRDKRPETFQWHFVDIPLSETTYDATLYCQDVPGRGDCLINAIDRVRATLADTKASNIIRAEALKFLVHFIGDIHQPFHAVADNFGENTLFVTFFIDPRNKNREPTNLHAVWDTNLIRNQFWAWGTYVQWLEDYWLPNHDVKSLSSGTPVEWLLESHKIAVEAVKDVPLNADLDQSYATRMRPYLDQQLAVAGVRLARILNETLK